MSLITVRVNRLKRTFASGVDGRLKRYGSIKDLEKDAITCFTYAAMKAAERKDAARCQVEPAGEAA